MNRLSVSSPMGPLTIVASDTAVTALLWTDSGTDKTDLLSEAAAQLEAYFDGRLTDFALPLSPEGSSFQKDVCAQMQAIPFGETRTYGDLAKALGAPAQAIGQACGGNPIPILIPCHRVLGARNLGGFSGGRGCRGQGLAVAPRRCCGPFDLKQAQTSAAHRLQNYSADAINRGQDRADKRLESQGNL